MSEKNRIIIDVKLDAQKIPEKMWWSAEGKENHNETKAFFLSLFDPHQKDTLKIDLWTKDMSIPEMQVFMHNTLKSMARTFARAIGDEKHVEQFDQLADNLTADQ